MTTYLNVTDLAERLNVSVATIRKWRAEGTAPPAKKFGRAVRWAPADVEQWEEQHSDPPAA